ncbi:MAG TPA: glycosyltransferase family 39 protein [Chthoniobacterales bacterium]|nr:glycosyltransferase family 39 protein [Chthoniobacterales bacterium]
MMLYAAVCVVVFTVAMSLRVRAAINDLWLDEIWSLELVRDLHSPLEVFTKIHHDNNHYLNSLFIYFLGQRGNWPGYRALAVVAGFGTAVLAWLIGRRRDKWAAFFSMILVSFSYVLILYSSEARGYAPLLFFCFLCFHVLESFLDKPRWETALWFSLGAILGFSSHLTFVNFFVASLFWFCTRLVRSGNRLTTILGRVTACYAAPVIYLIALYVVDIRHMDVGGGTPIGLLEGYAASLAWTLGAPNVYGIQMISVGVAVTGLLAGLAILWRKELDLLFFFLVVVVIMPLGLAALQHGDLHYVRYFIVAVGFLVLLFGRVLGWLYERGRWGKIACVLFCGAYLVTNSWHLASLFKYGRGHTQDALQFMVENSKQSPVSFGGDQDFRIHFVLAFYWRETMPGKAMEYYEHERWPSGGPEWVIFHRESFKPPVPPGKQFYDKSGNWFELARIFPTAPLSGVHWFIYHNRDR